MVVSNSFIIFFLSYQALVINLSIKKNKTYCEEGQFLYSKCITIYEKEDQFSYDLMTDGLGFLIGFGSIKNQGEDLILKFFPLDSLSGFSVSQNESNSRKTVFRIKESRFPTDIGTITLFDNQDRRIGYFQRIESTVSIPNQALANSFKIRINFLNGSELKLTTNQNHLGKIIELDSEFITAHNHLEIITDRELLLRKEKRKYISIPICRLTESEMVIWKRN